MFTYVYWLIIDISQLPTPPAECLPSPEKCGTYVEHTWNIRGTIGRFHHQREDRNWIGTWTIEIYRVEKWGLVACFFLQIQHRKTKKRVA